MNVDILSEARALMQALDRRGQRPAGLPSTRLAIQKDGSVQSNRWRSLNFQGAGVVVTEDEAALRTNVNIPGGSAGTAATTIFSAAATGKVTSATAGSEPANWQQPSFNDAAWSAPIASTGTYVASGWGTPSGGAWVTQVNGIQAAGYEFLLRHTFSITPGSIAGVTLQMNVDNIADVYLDGNLVGSIADTSAGGQPPPLVTFNVSSSLFAAGVSHTLAIRVQNTLSPTNPQGVATVYRLDVNVITVSAVPYINIQDQKAQNTSGGNFASGADQTRVLNTIHADSAGIASLSANQLTLPSGTYRCFIRCPAALVGNHQAWLFNVTASAVLVRGSSQYADAANVVENESFIAGRFTLAATSVLEVRHRCQTTNATTGFGGAANFGTEVYTVAEFFKES